MSSGHGTAKAKTTKQLRAERRRELKGASLMAELAWWAADERRSQLPAGCIASEVKRIQRGIARLCTVVPSMTWFDDARSQRRDAGGSFPPCDDLGIPLMIKGRGEARLYPPQYITSSGHAYHVFCDVWTSGTSEQLFEDGYNGSRVSIYDLTDKEQRRIRRKVERAVKRGDRHRDITNSI